MAKDKKKSSGDKKTKQKTAVTPPVKRGNTGIGQFARVFAGILLLVAIYVTNRKQPEKATYNNTEYQIQRVTERLKYDENGFVVGRKLPEVKFMPPSAASEYEFKNPEELSSYIKFLPGPPMAERSQRAMGARFKNFYNFDLTMWWDDNTENGVYSGVVQAKGFSSTNTYTTHSFLFKNRNTNELIAKITMKDDRHLYFIGPAEGDEETFNSEEYKKSLAEVEFMKEYHTKNGVPWLSHYPRGPPQLFLYPADFVGQKHHIKSFIGYHESPTKQSEEPVNFDITVLSTVPRILLVPNLLNDFEINHVVKMGEKVVKQSLVGSGEGGFQSKTRTSENGWLKRTESVILNRIYYRFADVLRMSDNQLRDDGNGAAENLQFVRYLESQRYDAHHDFGYTGRTEQRFSTLLIYLEVPEEGGGTSFPKAFNGQGISVKPSKGDAVLFYSMLPDGNGDDMSLHSGMPVEKGRKYVCNLWSWDPKYK